MILINKIRGVFSAGHGSRFRQNFIKVARANVVGQAINALGVLVLARLYAPADFGVSAVFLSFANIVSAFATLRLEWSVPNTRTRVQAGVLVTLGGIILIATCILVVGAIGVFGDRLPLIREGTCNLGWWSLLLPLAVLGVGTQQLLQSWFVRETDLTAVSRVKITQSIASVVTGVAGGMTRLGTLGLVSSTVVSTWVGFVRLARQADGLFAALRQVSSKRVRVGWARFGKEALSSSLASVVNVASLTITPVFLSNLYAAADVGAYALMLRVAVTPVSVVTGAVAQSFWAEAANLIKRDRAALKKLYLRSTRRLLLLALPATMAAACGPLYVKLILGNEWANAGYVMAGLSPYLLGQIVVSPLSHLIVHQKQHWQLVWDVLRVIMVATMLVLLGQAKCPIYGTIFAASFVHLGMYAVLYTLNYKCLSK